jgi:hypothetical protein
LLRQSHGSNVVEPTVAARSIRVRIVRGCGLCGFRVRVEQLAAL